MRSDSKHRRFRRAALGALLLCVAIAGLPGCFDSGSGQREPEAPPPGSLGLRWRITALNKSCADAGLERVRIDLVSSEGTQIQATERCDDKGAELLEVPPGIYELTLSGLDADGRATYRVRESDLEVVAQQRLEVGLLELERLPARLVASWAFVNGRTCAYNGVRQVALWVYDFDAEKPLHPRVTFDCDYEDVFVVLEVPPGQVDVIASGLDAQGEPLFSAHERYDVAAEQEQEVDLRLQRCEEGGNEPGC